MVEIKLLKTSGLTDSIRDGHAEVVPGATFKIMDGMMKTKNIFSNFLTSSSATTQVDVIHLTIASRLKSEPPKNK